MSSTWSSSNWKERLTQNLEPILRSKNLEAEISTYQGVPFALFAYPPTAERQTRKEVVSLSKRLEQLGSRSPNLMSMADLLFEIIQESFPPDGSDLFEAERCSSDEPEVRLERLQSMMTELLSSIPQKIKERAQKLSPSKDMIFIYRVGALYPAYRASALLENLMGDVQVPTILFYPGTRTGRNSLRFMDSLDAIHSYRHKIY